MFPRWLTGGRPMRKVSFCFLDVVTGRPVFMFEDRYGRKWLAYHAWSWHRDPPYYGDLETKWS